MCCTGFFSTKKFWLFFQFSKRSANVEISERKKFPRNPLACSMKNTVPDGHTRKHRYLSCSARKGKASWRMRQDHLQEEPDKRKNQRCRAENIHPKAAAAGRLPGSEQPIMVLPSSHSSAECGSRNEGGSERSSEGLESHDGHLPWPVCAFRLWMRKRHPAPGSSVEQEPYETKNKQ